MKANVKMALSLAGAILLVALGVVVSFRAFKQIEDAAEARRQTFVVLDRANELLSELKDAETGQRGYALTGDEAFLQPYLAVRDSISRHLDELRPLTVNGATRKHLDALAPLVVAKMAGITQVIELRRRHDLTAVMAIVGSGQGMRLMDAIRAEMGSLVQVEEGILAQHDAEFHVNLRRMFALIVAASLLTLLFALSFAWFLYRETRHRLKNLVHLETEHLLRIQEETNQHLRQVNATVQAGEEKLAVTLNSIGDAVIATNAAGRITLLNTVAEQLTGWTLAEATERPVAEIFHIINQETRRPATIPVAETLAQGTIQGLANHTLLIARDGSERAIADSCAPIRDSDGHVVGAVLVFRDVTEEYAVQQALREKSAELEIARSVAEQANLAKSEFLSSMSHELRSPLNAILGFAQLLESDVPPPTPGQNKSIGQILKAGWHLLKLINDILDLAKIESGQAPLSPEPVSLSEVILEIRSMSEPQAQQCGVRIVIPPFDTRYFVHADRTRVKQVLLNLLSNAIKYNRTPGTVEVICDEGAAGRTRVSIRDTGAGLDADQVTQLFQAFNRLGQDASGKEGTGIGLVVAKRLVELMGGVIGVESTVGVGSVFWFELNTVAEPHLSREGDAVEAAPRSLVASGERLQTLLYVEDNPANLELVEQLVARYPRIRLLTAVDGYRGIETARAAQPDVILMDINLPGIDGFETLNILRSDPATAHIPVIALSANAMPRDIEKGRKAGFFNYITKPIKVKEFMEALNAALEDTHKGSS